MKPLLPIFVRLEDGTVREATERDLEERLALMRRARRARTDIGTQHYRESVRRSAAAAEPRTRLDVSSEAINEFALNWMLEHQRAWGVIAAAAAEFSCPEDVIRRRITLRLPSD